MLRAAIERARDPAPHPLLDVPVVLLDVPVASALDAELVGALAARAEVRAFVPSGDGRAVRRLARALGAPVEEAAGRGGPRALDRLAARLFARAEAEGPTPPTRAWSSSARRARAASAWRSRGACSPRPARACPSIAWPCSRTRPSATAPTSWRRCAARACPPTSRAARCGPIPPGARSWRCSPAKKKD
ncbi:MAG: hypothetical protein M5U28_06000 [Sandaracinaceae bacterium]|nr:hypothetical protein [Sandaracinaceae bacterium]